MESTGREIVYEAGDCGGVLAHPVPPPAVHPSEEGNIGQSTSLPRVGFSPSLPLLGGVAATRLWRVRRGGPSQVLTFLLLLPLLLAACSETPEQTPEVIPTDDVGELAPGAPEQEVDTVAKNDSAGPVVTDEVVMVTDRGEVRIGLYGEDAPKAVENFLGHIEEGTYDSILFHRVVENYIIQTGDPLTRDSTMRDQWGTGGESIWGGTFEDELDPLSPSGRLGYREGVLAMVNEGPDQNRSQFFFVLDDDQGARIPYAQTIFGKVLSGMETLRKIEETGRVMMASAGGDGEEEGFVQEPVEPALLVQFKIQK